MTHYFPRLRPGVCFMLLLAVVLVGCPSTQEVKKEEPPPPVAKEKKPAQPEITIQVASLDLSSYGKRIEKADILQFAGELKRLKIDILALEDITRYPGVSTRIDVVDELSKGMDARQAFGETITLNNRQGGNAVFSAYPIRSNENSHYTGLQSTGFEAALQAVVDCGVRDVVIVSTKLPQRASTTELASASNLFTGLSTFYINHPIIITGKIPDDAMLQVSQAYAEVQEIRDRALPRIWYSNDGSLKLDKVTIEKTTFGRMVVVQFGIFRQRQP